MAVQQREAPTTDAFVERIFEAGLATMDILSIHMGDRLGFYRVLATADALTAAELAERCGTDERQTREWLEQQAVTGILAAGAPDGGGADDPAARRFRLPPEHAEPLTDPNSLSSIAPFARSIAACGVAMPSILEGFRTGRGVEWSAYGADMIEAQGDFNRPWLLHSFGTEHLPSITDVHERLTADPPARVADVACGVGWASIAIAKAYPKASVTGIDLDATSIGIARGIARDQSVGDRVAFEVRDAADPRLEGSFDLVVMIEALHDTSGPVEILEAMRRMLAPGGVVLIADEKTEDRFVAPGSDSERIFYGYSILCCLPAAMTDRPTAATGTVMREATLRDYAGRAGFSDVQVLDLDLGLLRLYRLRS
jgi:2-polyprenyl-3-methyl-5-hydroxy-6-metoxy-1,4-benzoquinol methylase